MPAFNPHGAAEAVIDLPLRKRDARLFQASPHFHARTRHQELDGERIVLSLAFMLLDDFQRPGHLGVRAPDALLATLMRRNLPEGWGPADRLVEHARTFILATWKRSCGLHEADYTAIGARFLAAEVPAGWVPADAEDPIFRRLYDGS